MGSQANPAPTPGNAQRRPQPPTVPNEAQRKFAAGMVAGLSQEKAYSAAHPNNRGKVTSRRVNAKRSAKSPLVQAEVNRLLAAEFQLRPFPEANNLPALRDHVVKRMIYLTESKDEVIVLRACDWLKHYIEDREAVQAPSDTRADLFHDLSQLYRKALAAPQPAIVEAVAEEAEPEAVAVENPENQKPE